MNSEQHFHFHCPDVERLDRKLDLILTKLETLMALADDLKAGIAQLDAETNAVAALITSLAGKIKNSMTDQEVADVKAALTAEAARLTTLAVDPTQPVPPVPPPLAAVRAKH